MQEQTESPPHDWENTQDRNGLRINASSGGDRGPANAGDPARALGAYIALRGFPDPVDTFHFGGTRWRVEQTKAQDLFPGKELIRIEELGRGKDAVAWTTKEEVERRYDTVPPLGEEGIPDVAESGYLDEKYKARHAAKCPVCGSVNVGRSVPAGRTVLERDASCGTCGSTWTETYQISYIEHVERGERVSLPDWLSCLTQVPKVEDGGE